MSEMGGMIGLAAVVLSLGIPMAMMYTYYRVKKLKADERLAAIARGVAVPFEEPLPVATRSRRAAILLISGAVGFMATFGLIPLAVGFGYLLDFTLARREAHSQ